MDKETGQYNIFVYEWLVLLFAAMLVCIFICFIVLRCL